MKIAGNQSYFFPYIGYFQLINAVDKFIISDNLSFVNKGWVNRNKILVKNTGTIMVTVPLKNRNSCSKICDIKIDDQNGSLYWRKKLCKTIYVNYRQAHMFDAIFPFLEALINYPTEFLSELNTHAIESICNYLNINTIIENDPNKYRHIEELLFDSKYISDNYGDLESKIVRVLEICKYEKADMLFNLIGGSSLYSKDIFKKYNIDINFLKMGDITYKQNGGSFFPKLSIIDVLMYNPIERIREMLGDFELL